MSNEIKFSFPVKPADKIVFNLFNKLSYYLIPKWRLRNIFLASYLIKIIDRYKIDCIFDIGANTGQFGIFLIKQVGFKGKIISFEPAKKCFEELEKNAKKYSNWEVYHLAVSDKREEKVLHLTDASVLNSFKKPVTESHPDYTAGVKVTGEESVQCLPLDEFFKENNINPANCLLKSDTQGYDDVVVNSLGEYISKLPVIMAEVSVQTYYEDCMLYTEFIKMMANKNFELANLHPVTFDRFLRVVEFDALFINCQQSEK